MALNWNVSRCNPSACWTEPENPDQSEMTSTCHALIWATMVVGLNEITDANIPEWTYRLTMTARLFRWTKEPEGGFTDSFLRPFIGLNTNASRLTRAQFVKKTAEWLERDLGTAQRRPAVEYCDDEPHGVRKPIDAVAR